MRKLILQELINNKVGRFASYDYDSIKDLLKSNKRLATKLIEKDLQMILNEEVNPIVKRQCAINTTPSTTSS